MSVIHYTTDIFKETYITTLDRNYVVMIEYKKCAMWYHPKTNEGIINLFESCSPLHNSCKRDKKNIFFIFDTLNDLNLFINNVKKKFPKSAMYIHITRNLWR
jgi:hypothetical protein